jgi:hypothetical protein
MKNLEDQPSDTSSSSNANDHIPTAEDWSRWIEAKLLATAGGYGANPDWMKGHYNNERSVASDYAGRELLELVQNAADAANEYGGCGKVRIEISKHGICVANTGMPFRSSGVASLMTAHTSDKPDRQASLIGAKGLGFRALLNWSAEPFICSGNLEIGFSKEHAEKTARVMAQEYPMLMELINSSTTPPVPILAFPSFGSALDDLSDESMKLLMENARKLRVEGYDTVVVAAFDKPDAFKAAVDQLAEFKPDFLLFVDALDEITFKVSDKAETCWRKSRVGEEAIDIEIDTGGILTFEKWLCKRREEHVLDPSDENTVRPYELAIAIKREGVTAAGKLHCYFPTDVYLPLPALFHATLELDSNRKSLNAGSNLNAQVLEALAQFYAELIATLTENNSISDPLAYLGQNGAFPDVLNSFAVAVRKAAASRPLIPTLAGKRVAAAATLIGPPNYVSYLPKRLFGSMAKCDSLKERSTLEWLGVAMLDLESMVAKLKDANLNISERARVISGIAENVPAEFHDRTLLIDSTGANLTARNTCFPPPATGKPPRLPTWAKAKFLHPSLWKKLSVLMPGTLRSRFDRLEKFGINEFNAAGVINSLRGQATSALKNKRQNPDKIRRELLATLLDLRQGVARGVQYPGAHPQVFCADGEWREASKAHLSHRYGNYGRITGALYATQPELLMGSPEENGLAAEPDALNDFCRWIGVHVWPSKVSQTLPIDLRAVIEDALPDQFDVVDGHYRGRVELSEISWSDNCRVNHDWLAGFDGILSSAPSAAILAWLGLDPRFNIVSPTAFETRLEARSGTTSFKQYQKPLPDLVRHQISVTPWLQSTDGERVPPRDCMLTTGKLGVLFHHPARMSEDDVDSLGITRAVWDQGLRHALVPSSLAELTEVQIYRLLMSLRKREVGSDVIRRLYAQVIDLEEFDPSAGASASREFKREGQIQVRRAGSIVWAPVADALYLDRDNLPTAARSHFALIDIPPRRNATNIEAIFGAAPLSKRNFELTVTKVIEEEGYIAANLQRRLNDALPFIKAYRLASSTDTARLRRLDALCLKVVKVAELEFSSSGEFFSGTLEPGKHVLNNNDLLIAVNVTEHEEEIMLRATTAISDGLAELFGLQASDDFEKLLSATTSGGRQLQFKRLLSNYTDKEIQQLLSNLDGEIAEAEEPSKIDAPTLALGMGPSPTLTDESGVGLESRQETPSPAVDTSETDSSFSKLAKLPPPLPPPVATAVKVTPLEIVENANPSRGRSVGIRMGRGSGVANYSNIDVEAPSDAEQWALFFEKSQNRHAIQVSRIQGTNGFGCDCLSFATAENEEAFKADPSKVDLVARFIEVKSGTVRLTPNEVKAAQLRKERYFIYQLVFSASSRESAHLTIVSNPLNYPGALARECEVRISDIPDRVVARLNAVID